VSSLNGRLQKLERKEAPYERISAIIHRIVEPGKNGPVGTGRALAVIPGLNAPQVIKCIKSFALVWKSSH
jgi:hypothetical protein